MPLPSLFAAASSARLRTNSVTANLGPNNSLCSTIPTT